MLPMDAFQGLVDGHSADGDGGVLDDGGADFIQIAAPGGQVHQRIGSVTSPPGSVFLPLR